MQSPSRINRVLVNNLVWFAGSLMLALFVWIIATFQSDPIQQQRFPERIPVDMMADEGLLVTYPPNPTASVVVRAPRSVLDLLTAEEIELQADLRGLGPGEHAVELQPRIARQRAIIVDMSPRVLRVTLEEASARQVPLRAVVSNEPPMGYSRDEPTFDVNLNQLQVSGPTSRVQDVVAAQVVLDLSQQRTPVEMDTRPVPVNADGAVVNDVTLDPQIVRVYVNVRRREDVREVSVRPNITGSLPEGYVLNSLTYDPQAVLVSGSPDQLARLPDTLTTAPIDLTNRTSSFELSVPVMLPNNGLLLLSEQAIRVSVEINALTSSRQFDEVPVQIIGIEDGYDARSAPSQVSVLITGPEPSLDKLRQEDIRVTVDLNGQISSDQAVRPAVSLATGAIPGSTISVLPAEIDVDLVQANTLHNVPR